MKKTTIKIGKCTKQELDNIKSHPRETYEDVINRLIDDYKKYNSIEINTFNVEEFNQQINDYLKNLRDTPEDNIKRAQVLFQLANFRR